MIRVFLVLIALSSCVHGEDMMKIVYRDIAPDTPVDSFALQPKTLYKYGTAKGRLEEMPDPKLRLHGLIIANEKDVWMINLWDKTGKHIIDPGPTYGFHAGIVPPEEEGKPAKVGDFEIGQELSFMEKRKVEPKKTTLDGKDLLLYECVEDGITLRLYVSPETKLPQVVSAHDGAKVLVQLQYDEYTPSLPVDESLFSPPAGVKIIDDADVKEFGQRMLTFYLSATPETFTKFQSDTDLYENALAQNGNGADLALAASIAAISRKHQWPITGTGKVAGAAREILEGKSKLAQFVLDDAAVDPAKLDIWWMSFFGTGDTQYLSNILKYAGEPLPKNDGNKLLVIGSATWSFKSNCRQDKNVKEFARSQIDLTTSPEKKNFLTECASEENK